MALSDDERYELQQESTKNKLDDSRIATPKADRIRHLNNTGELATYFFGSLGISLLGAYIKSFEPVSIVIYVGFFFYVLFNFEYNPKGHFFRLFITTLGLVFGFREIFTLFFYQASAVAVLVITGVIVAFKLYRMFSTVIYSDYKDEN